MSGVCSWSSEVGPKPPSRPCPHSATPKLLRRLGGYARREREREGLCARVVLRRDDGDLLDVLIRVLHVVRDLLDEGGERHEHKLLEPLERRGQLRLGLLGQLAGLGDGPVELLLELVLQLGWRQA